MSMSCDEMIACFMSLNLAFAILLFYGVSGLSHCPGLWQRLLSHLTSAEVLLLHRNCPVMHSSAAHTQTVHVL